MGLRREVGPVCEVLLSCSVKELSLSWAKWKHLKPGRRVISKDNADCTVEHSLETVKAGGQGEWLGRCHSKLVKRGKVAWTTAVV